MGVITETLCFPEGTLRIWAGHKARFGSYSSGRAFSLIAEGYPINNQRGALWRWKEENSKHSLIGSLLNQKQERKYTPQRLQELEKNHAWIQADRIKEMPDEELKNRFIEYYKNGSGLKQSLNQLNRDRIVRNLDRFRETLIYLLDESIDIKVRIAQCIRGQSTD